MAMKVIILGGGLAGLETAVRLVRGGCHVTVVEKDKVPGGMVGTFAETFNGEKYFFDYGPHLYFHEHRARFEEYLQEPLLSFEGYFSMAANRKMVLYPFQLGDLLRNYGPLFFARMIGSAAWSRISRKFRSAALEDATAASWMQEKFGNFLFQEVFKSYIEKNCLLPAEEVSPLWFSERKHVTGGGAASVIFAKLFSLLPFSRKEKVNQPTSTNLTAFYPRGGSGTIPEAMADLIRKHDGEVLLDTVLESIEMDEENRRIRQIAIRRDGEGEILDGDFFVSTIPLPEFIRALPSYIDDTYVRAAASLRSVTLVLLYLIVKMPKVAVPMEIFFADPEIPFKRIYEPRNLMPDSAPENRTSLCLEICVEDGEEINPADLFARSIRGLEKYGLLEEKHILSHFFREVPNAYPRYQKGFEKERMRLYRYISTFENLICTGRQGLFKYGSMTHQVMEMAKATAAHILSGEKVKGKPVDGPDLPFV